VTDFIGRFVATGNLPNVQAASSVSTFGGFGFALVSGTVLASLTWILANHQGVASFAVNAVNTVTAKDEATLISGDEMPTIVIGMADPKNGDQITPLSDGAEVRADATDGVSIFARIVDSGGLKEVSITGSDGTGAMSSGRSTKLTISTRWNVRGKPIGATAEFTVQASDVQGHSRTKSLLVRLVK